MTDPGSIKVVLVDADGVLVVPQKPFSHAHAEAHSFDFERIEPFFEGEFRQATVGKADLKELVVKHHDLWGWHGEPDELLARWFAHENKIDHALLALIQKLRRQNIAVYLATDQEKYRAAYMRDVMFPGTLDGIFASCDLGYEKRQPEFFKAVLAKLRRGHPTLEPEEVIFFDDSQGKVDSAVRAGIQAELYTGSNQIAQLLE